MTMELVPADREEQVALERITTAIGGARQGAKPPADWQARVMAKVRAEEAAKAAAAAKLDEDIPLSLSWKHSMPTLCAAALMLLWWSPWRSDAPPRALEVEVQASATARRGDGEGASASLGSRVTVAAVSDAPYRAVWIFRGRDELAMACPGRGCSSTEDRLSAALTIELVGEYTAVALWSEQPLPSPGGDRDGALAAAARAGATVQSQKLRVW